jgi:hypothetical protein
MNLVRCRSDGLGPVRALEASCKPGPAYSCLYCRSRHPLSVESGLFGIPRLIADPYNDRTRNEVVNRAPLFV